jgi:hypothetical protein
MLELLLLHLPLPRSCSRTNPQAGCFSGLFLLSALLILGLVAY